MQKLKLSHNDGVTLVKILVGLAILGILTVGIIKVMDSFNFFSSKLMEDTNLERARYDIRLKISCETTLPSNNCGAVGSSINVRDTHNNIFVKSDGSTIADGQLLRARCTSNPQEISIEYRNPKSKQDWSPLFAEPHICSQDPPLVTCTLNQRREWYMFGHWVTAPPQFTHTASRTLSFPLDATDFNVRVVGVYADDYSPKAWINGTMVVNKVDPWRKSYASLITPVDVSSLLTAGANTIQGSVRDITGTLGQHLGVGLCFAGTYRAATCGSPLEGPNFGYRCGQ